MSTTKSSRAQTIKISLTSSEMKQFRVVKELKPEWNEQQCVDYCKDRNWDPTEIQSSLQAAFEFDRESQEEWHEVSKKQPASVVAKTVERGASSTRGRSSERGGFSSRGRGRARSAGANRGSRDGNPAEESKSGTDEKTVEETKPVEKRPFVKKPMKKESKPALATPIPGKSYSAALLAKLPQPAPVQPTPAPANVAPKAAAAPAPTQSSAPVEHSKAESKSEHTETKSEVVHQVLPTPTPNVSFAAALASGGQATKWKKKETKKQEIEAVHHPETTEQIAPAKVEESVQIIAEPAKEEKPMEQEHHSHQETHQLAVPASPARNPQPTPHHDEVVAAAPVHKSPSHSPLPKSPISKSPQSKAVHSHAHPSPSHAPLPPPHTAPAPLPVTAPVIVEPLSELLAATETVILPSHLQAAVSASAPAVQFGSFGKAAGPRAPQPAPLAQPAPVTVNPPVSVPAAVAAPATTFAPSTSISSHQTRFPSPASALGGILPSAVSTQTDNSKTIGQFPTRVEAATETANASSNDYEQSLNTEEQTAPTASPQQSYASDTSDHNLYSANFNQLNQSGQASAGQADAYSSPQSTNYEQSSDPYSSMYQGESQYSMYQGDQSSFYGNAMRQQNKPDMNKNQQNKNQAANKFNNPAAGVVGPANQQQRQPQNKPPRQQQTQQGPFGAQDQYNKGNNQRYPNQQQQQAYGNPNVNQYANKHPQSPSHPQQAYGQPKGAVGQQQQGGYKGGFNKQNVPINQQQVGQFGVGHPYQIAQQPMSYNSVYGYPSGYAMTPQYYPSAQYPNFAPRGPYGYPYNTFSPYGPSMTQSFETDYQSDYSKQMYSSQPPTNQPAVGQQGGDMQAVGQGSVQPTDNSAAGYGADPSSWQQMKPQPKPSDSQQYPTGYAMQPQFQPAGPVHHHQPSMQHSQQPHTHAPVAGPSYQQPMGSYQPHVPGLHPDQARYQNTQWSQ